MKVLPHVHKSVTDICQTKLSLCAPYASQASRSYTNTAEKYRLIHHVHCTIKKVMYFYFLTFGVVYRQQKSWSSDSDKESFLFFPRLGFCFFFLFQTVAFFLLSSESYRNMLWKNKACQKTMQTFCSTFVQWHFHKI